MPRKLIPNTQKARRQFTQTLGLVSPINTFRVIFESAVTIDTGKLLVGDSCGNNHCARSLPIVSKPTADFTVTLDFSGGT
jgi:hypothetical protein